MTLAKRCTFEGKKRLARVEVVERQTKISRYIRISLPLRFRPLYVPKGGLVSSERTIYTTL